MQGAGNKRPRGILKNSSSFDKNSGSHRKSAKFDENNVLETYHPPNKDYGHMKIEEPKTPYNYVDPDQIGDNQLDPQLLAEKLSMAARSSSQDYDDSSDDETEETDEERGRRKEFEKRRKAHYNEFEAVRLARKLIKEEDDEDDDDEEENSTVKIIGNTDDSGGSKSMDTEGQELVKLEKQETGENSKP